MLLAVYIVIVLLHLFACFTGRLPLRYFTKPFIIPLLIVIAYASGAAVPTAIYFSLVFAFIGDILMMRKDLPIALLGGIIAFGVSHVLHIVEISKSISHPSGIKIAIALIVYIGVGAFVFLKLNKYIHQQLKIPTFFYTILLATASFTAFLSLISLPSFSRTLIFLGSLFFMVSDTVLGFQIFKRNWKYADFSVMASYILAQTLITYGYILA